jgi:hypothetical protein
MITVVYFEDIDGYKVVVAAFLMTYDAKVFIEADKNFKKLEMQELTLDAWQGWEVIIGQTNKVEGKHKMDYIVVWKPEYTEEVTVSLVTGTEGMLIGELMDLAHEYEGLGFGKYELYNIIKTTDADVVW